MYKHLQLPQNVKTKRLFSVEAMQGHIIIYRHMTWMMGGTRETKRNGEE